MCGNLPSNFHVFCGNGFQKWQDLKKSLLKAVKGTEEAKVVKLIFSQHEVLAFDFSPTGFINNHDGQMYNYMIRYKDFEAMSNELIYGGRGIGWIHNKPKIHAMYFKKLPMNT